MLDLVSGLFGLLVVLYAMTSANDGDIGATSLPLKFVRVQLEGSHTAPIGLEIMVGGETHRSWPDCNDAGAVTWGSCESGLTEALVESNDPIDSIRFMLLKPPEAGGKVDFSDVKVWVTTPEKGRLCTLVFATAYRGDFKDSYICKDG